MAQTRNDRTNPFTGAVNWTAVSDESQTVELHTDKGLYGFYLVQWPQQGSVSVADVSTGAATGAGLTVISSGTPGAGQCRPDTTNKTGWVQCHSSDNGKSLLIDYNGGGYVMHEQNVRDIVNELAGDAGAAAAAEAINELPQILSIQRDSVDTDHDLEITEYYGDGTSLTITKQLDATFADGDNAGGMQSGDSLPTSGVVYIYRLTQNSDGSVDYIATDGSALVVPSGYTQAAASWVFATRTDSSANLRAFTYFHRSRRLYWDDTLTQDLAVTDQGTSDTTRTSVNGVPGAIMIARLTCLHGSEAYVTVGHSNRADQAPTTTGVPQHDVRYNGTYITTTEKDIPLDDSNQYKTKSSAASTSVYIQGLGFHMPGEL